MRISKSPLDAHEVATLRDLGLGTVTALAGTDPDDVLPEYLPRASHREDAEERLRRAHHRALLLDAGVQLERETRGELPLPRHELEIDVDIETSADDRVYLWGFWVDDPASGPPYAKQFAAFEDLDADGERALAAEAMAWLHGLVEGRDAAVYHYSDYEVVRLGRLASHLGELGLVGAGLGRGALRGPVHRRAGELLRRQRAGPEGGGTPRWRGSSGATRIPAA
jgi:predicted RecB family nuclease